MIKVTLSIVGVILIYTLGYIGLKSSGKIVVIRGYNPGKEPTVIHRFAFTSFVYGPAEYIDLFMFRASYVVDVPTDMAGLLIPGSELQQYRNAPVNMLYLCTMQKESQSDVMKHYDTKLSGWTSSGWNAIVGGTPPTMVCIYSKPNIASPFSMIVVRATASAIGLNKSNLQIEATK